MRWTSLFVFPFIWLLVAGCSDDLGYMAPTPTPTRIVAKPQVLSASPDVVVQPWQYLGPDAGESFNWELVRLQGIRFGPDRYEAYVFWYSGGFDLIWRTFPCSIQPILTVGAGTMTLWLNEAIWDDCVAMEANHAFRVEVATDIPPEAWRYAIHEGAPADSAWPIPPDAGATATAK